jgi:HD-GYP domain-containing protein (c-di-GMP phosphodiesterase class II)
VRLRVLDAPYVPYAYYAPSVSLAKGASSSTRRTLRLKSSAFVHRFYKKTLKTDRKTGKQANMDKSGEAAMSDTQVLMSKIVALRQHLEQVQGLAKDAGSAAASLVQNGKDDPDRVRRLERQVAAGSQHSVLLDRAVRQLVPTPTAAESTVLPKQLTARARRLVLEGRNLLDELRGLGGEFSSSAHADPLTARYHETVAMADTALRMVQAFPDAPSAQLHLCEGLEAILHVAGERIAGLRDAVTRRRHEASRVDRLVEVLTGLHAGGCEDIQPVVDVAAELIAEAQQSAPLPFLYASPEQPVQFIACHSLTVAQVMARLVRHDADFRYKPLEPVLAALLHDAGMMAVPESILNQTSPLDDSQRRLIESHATVGAEMMTRLLPAAGWLAEATGRHHERLDGTGYPGGLRDLQIASLTRLLSVCDVYAALCSPRPHRAALDTRTALTDTLLLAKQGLLDRNHAERLFQLSFYPVGSIVELADGAVGLVVATHLGRRDLNTPARPVLALLTDAQGQALPTPQHIDLAQCDSRSIVRSLPRTERRELLGQRYPELA